VEAPLPVATPFLEYGLALPLGVEGGTLVAPDGQLEPVGSVAPQTLALGAKVTALPNLTLTAAAELGLTRRVGRGIAPTPPFNLFLGASFNADPLQSGGRQRVDSPREPRAVAMAAGTAQVSGVVVDAKTRQPLPGVLVAMVDSSLPPVASDLRSGRFLTYALPSGPVKLLAFKEGYRPLEHQVELKAGETATVELALEQDAKPATFSLAITSRKRAVGATLTFRGPEPRQVTLSQAEAASHQLQLKAGNYRVEVLAPGYLAQQRLVRVSEGAALALAFELESEPKQKQVKVDGDKMELLQPLRFADGKAVLLPDSHPLLAQVADAIIRGGFKRLRVEGHTYNQGDGAVNLKLSKERARAVMEYLLQAGLEPERLESAGYGDTRPIAPNLTPRGRELNRRVDLVILER
jgi:OOP family OmpA-OmpF porin